MKHTSVLSALLVGASVAVTASAFAPAHAFDLTFTNETNNVVPDAASLFKVNVSEVKNSSNIVTGIKFDFSNTGNAVITEIWFGKGTQLPKNQFSTAPFSNYFSTNINPVVDETQDQITEKVDFELSNNDSTGEKALGWSAVEELTAANPRPTFGIGKDETLSITLAVNSGITLQTVRQGFESTDLVIGLHAQSIWGGGSDKFESNQPSDPSEPVPEPITMFGLSVGLAGGGLLKQKYGKKANQEKVTV